ncbi:beta-lactamase domain-containing protein [Alcanivorax xiamenensis]|uniref:Beta-lactamase domain-containing protein n=1 Tax=Alcanivorax xiamenensis TaxID=1177156 RepID=A0ABQ6Y8P9_9GAMM|nr:alkyl sulfatase dimerization domain-containing protein [Alcanivorax xiamenensis]KAF0805597.1 beta-lactamase domain-containing protein [Alcanivorax xiamenensis]
MRFLSFSLLFPLFLVLTACGGENASGPAPALAPEALREHSTLFRKGVEEVTDGVYVAIGYGLANSIMLEGDDGIVIVDTMSTQEEGQEVLAAFREITDKPVKALIYTHNHADHVFGARAFAAPGEVPVYAHATTQDKINRVVNEIRPIITLRSMRMFGTYLDGSERINDGIGPHLGVNEDSNLFSLTPDHTFEDELDLNIAGLHLRLIHAPGETDDQLFVWLPEKKVVLSGDNIYQAFPNLYTIRGTAYRDVAQWARSLDKIRALEPEYLVPSHTRPLIGAQRIHTTLTHYRDAIQYVHDQTLRYMNLGLTPDQIVEKVQLPPHLASDPWLQEFYGKVSWSVRSIFSGYLGWFDGNSSTLQPRYDSEQAQRMADLAGGTEALMSAAQKALKNQDAQWALSLTDHLQVLTQGDQAVTDLRARALRQLAEQESNPNARNYYFTEARELEQGLKPGRTKTSPEFLATLPIENFLGAMPSLLKAEETLEVNEALGFRFRDTGKTFTLRIRQGIALIESGLDDDSVATLDTSEITWKSIAAGSRSAALALAGGDLNIDGDKLDALRILGYFEKIE